MARNCRILHMPMEWMNEWMNEWMAVEICSIVFRLRHCMFNCKVSGKCISSNLITYKDITWIFPSAPIATWDGKISGFMYVPPIWKKKNPKLWSVLVCIQFCILYL
jgi:hypothetical protein